MGYPGTEPREVLAAAIAVAEENPTEAAGATLEAALDAYMGTTDVVLPADGEKYTITMVAKNGNRFYLNYTGSDIAMVARGEEELPESAQFLCKENGDGTVTLTTNDGKYLVYHSSYNGVNWLQGNGDTDGLQESEDEMTKITFAKMSNGGNVAANDNKQIFGLLTWYSKRGYDTGKNEESYGYMVLKTDGSNYDGASAPFWNDNYSSGLLLEQVLESAEKTLAALESGGHGGQILRVVQNDNVGCQPERSEVSVTKKKNTIKPHNVREGRVESDGALQLSFFQLEDPLLSSLKEDLEKADLNNMTPLQAFDLLRNMKEQLGI